MTVETVPPRPLASAFQLLPSQRAMRLAFTPPAVVKVPPRRKLVPVIAMLLDARKTPFVFRPLSADHCAPSHLATPRTPALPARTKFPTTKRFVPSPVIQEASLLSSPAVPTASGCQEAPFHRAT